MKWWITAGILCLFGISKEFRPMEPYLYNYQHENLNISDSDLNGQIYPIWTYSYLIALIPALLLTDVFLYKPVLIFESICYISVWITLIFYKSIFSQQLGQAVYGFATATEVAYFAYIYVKVDRKKFSKVTAWTRAALLAGKCSSYFISEFFVLFHWGNLQTLNYISISSLFIALILSIFLPNVSWKSIVNRSVEYQKGIVSNGISETFKYPIFVPWITVLLLLFSASTLSTPTPPEIIPHNYISFAINHIKNFKKQICEIYADWKVLKWSFWWAMATCGELQIGNYTQTLWGQLQDSSGKDTMNGFIEAACPFVSMIVILAMERPKINWDRWGELCLTLSAFIDCLVLIAMASAQRLWIMYTGYIIFRVAYQAMITTAQFNLVCRIASNNLGFVFGINTFIALSLQTALTAIVVEKSALGLSIRKQFYVYSAYHAGIGFVFLLAIIGRIARNRWQSRRRSTTIF